MDVVLVELGGGTGLLHWALVQLGRPATWTEALPDPSTPTLFSVQILALSLDH